MAEENNFLKRFIKNMTPIVRYCWDFFLIVFIYGFLLSFSLSALFPARFTFNIITLFACGIIFYFIKEELPRIVLKMQQSNRSREGQ